MSSLEVTDYLMSIAYKSAVTSMLFLSSSQLTAALQMQIKFCLASAAWSGVDGQIKIDLNSVPLSMLRRNHAGRCSVTPVLNSRLKLLS